MEMDLPSGEICGSVRRAILLMLSMPKRAAASVAAAARIRVASLVRRMANTIMSLRLLSGCARGVVPAFANSDTGRSLQGQAGEEIHGLLDLRASEEIRP